MEIYLPCEITAHPVVGISRLGKRKDKHGHRLTGFIPACGWLVFSPLLLGAPGTGFICHTGPTTLPVHSRRSLFEGKIDSRMIAH